MTTVLVVGEGVPLLARMRRVAPAATIICLTAADGQALREQQALCDQVVRAAGPDLGEWLHCARDLHLHRPIDVACSFGEAGQRECAAIAASLGVPWHSAQTIENVYDKVTMRGRLRAAGLSSVRTTPVGDAAALAAIIAGNPVPLIVKPRAGSGSVGVRLVGSPDDAEDAFAAAVGAGRYGGRPVLAETFVPGPEFSVEAFSHQGRHAIVAVTSKVVACGTKVELGHVLPAAIDAGLRGRIDELVPRCLDTLGVTFGPTHTELVAGPVGVEVIETHTRCGGGRITDLVREAVGVDLVELTVLQALGRLTGESFASLRDLGGRAGYAGIFFLVPECPGEVQPEPSAMAEPVGDDLVELDLSGLAGLDGSRAPASNHDRGPYCIVRGTNVRAVAETAARVASGVRVSVRDPSSGQVHQVRLQLAASAFLATGLPGDGTA